MPKPNSPTDMLILEIWRVVCLARVSYPDVEAALIIAIAIAMKASPELVTSYYLCS